MTSSIVCGIDHSTNARAAARVAAKLSERLGLRLILVHAIPTDTPPPVAADPPVGVFDRAALRGAAEHEVASLLADVRDVTGAPDAIGRIEEGPAPERLAAVAAEEKAAFTVVGTRGEGAMSAALHGSVSIATVQMAPCPVIVVPPAVSLEKREPLAGTRIVCGVKSAEDRSVVHGAARLAASVGLPLTLAHVREPQDRDLPGATVHAVPLAAAAPPGGRTLADLHSLLVPLVLAAQRIAPQVDDPAVLAGDPAQRLAAIADEMDAALLVVGTRARGPIRSGLMGSVSRSLACSATVPVVIDPLRSATPA